ncbi:KH domain-containing protein [Anabaena sp. WFMT]|uniref:KH domain-containing protein n=1 Tax=Anabaena sp. WFMT TaxID=3449730 RepID=UPI003F2893EE
MKSPTASPDYVGLVQFLVQPFLESPESLSVDCEISPTLKRAWIRIAFEATDKGKVFGRGGRNIQAIRTVIAAAAELAGQSVHLDIYGSNSQSREGMSFDEEQEERIPPPKSRERSGNVPMPVAKPRFR